jgi:hypothetical protein
MKLSREKAFEQIGRYFSTERGKPGEDKQKERERKSPRRRTE